MKIKQITESTAGGTSSGAIASVASPMGTTQKRAGSLFKGKKTKKKFYEGEIKRIATDMDELSNAAFKKKYGKTKEEMRASLKEEKISEQDLIVMPGMRRMKDTSFIPHKADRRDHEVEMARSDLYAAAKDAMRIFKILKDRSEEDGLMGWQQSYITLAADYLNSVADSIEYNAKVKGGLDEMTGGVLAGGMSNFEESTRGWAKSEAMIDKMLDLRNQAKMAADRQQYSKLENIKKQLEDLENQILMLPRGKSYLDSYYKMLGTDIDDTKHIEEKAVSKQQQKFMGMVHAIQKGKKIPGASKELKAAAKGMSKKAAHDYAATKHKDLPKKVKKKK